MVQQTSTELSTTMEKFQVSQQHQRGHIPNPSTKSTSNMKQEHAALWKDSYPHSNN